MGGLTIGDVSISDRLREICEFVYDRIRENVKDVSMILREENISVKNSS